jgi:Putative glucoamylase
VVTPRASFLAMAFDRRAALANLAKLRRDFDVYGEGGFYDAVNVDTGQVSRFWLALDQA